ncbi:MAG: hypothetical protein NT029_01225 [Armatimonadetes bacterium]|nr:hypothetical protein [Armatimonadota bacterium]
MTSIPRRRAGRPPAYLVRPWKVRGRCLCYDLPRDEYYIGLRDLSPRWIDHVREKTWGTSDVIHGLRRAVAWRMGVTPDALPPSRTWRFGHE